MKKINSQLLFTGVIIAAFCCSFLVYIPITTRSVNYLSTPTKSLMGSTASGSSNPTGDEWPMFHCSLNHTGVTETTPVVSANINWSDAISSSGNEVWSDTAVANGWVYVGNYNGNVYRLNASTGAQNWTYTTDTTGGSVLSTPAVTNGMVYVGSADDKLYCLNASTGASIWNYTTGFSVLSSPAVANGMVYVGSNDDNIYCLNASTGALNWTFNTGNFVESSPAVANGMVYVGSWNGNIYCLYANNGTQDWNYTTSNSVDSSPAVANGMVYVGSNDDCVYCLYANNGTQDWNYNTTGEVTSSPAVANGMVYVGSQNHYVFCFNASSGAVIWNYDTQWTVESSPAVANGMVYVGSDNNSVYCFNALSGAVIWHYFAGIGSKGFASSPAIANGMVYEGGNDGSFYCFPMIFGSIPSEPLNPKTTPGNWQIFLSWNAPANNGSLLITGYNIYRGTSSGSETYLTTVGNVLNFTDTNVMLSTIYYYEVSAINPAGEGSNSTEISGTILTGDEWPMFHNSLNHIGVTETTPVVSANINWTYNNPGAAGTEVWSSPAITNGWIYVGCDDSKVYRLNASTGALNWTYSTGKPVQSSPAVVNGMVYVGSDDDHVYCLSASTGAQIWNYTTNNAVLSSPAVVNGMVYVGSEDHYVYCLYANNGTLDWKYTTSNQVVSSPTVVNGMVYVGSWDGNIYCLYANNGTLDWNYYTGWIVESSPAVVNGMVYVGSDNNSVNCLYANNGTLDWSYNTGSKGGVASSPAVANGMVYVGSNNGNVYCLNATDGTLIWNYNTQNTVESSPAVANGMVFVGSDNNILYCFNALSGAVIWQYNAGSGTNVGFPSSPAVANGMVYEGCNNGNFYRFPMIFGSVPSKPLNPTATPYWQVFLSWNAPANNGNLPITGYNIYRGTSSGSETYLTTVGNVLNFTDTNVIGATTYYYEVSAINLAGEGPNSTEISATTLTSSDWPMFHHSLNHTGVTETTPVVSANINWAYFTSVSGNKDWSAPAVVDGMVYVGSDDDHVYCLNATNGTQIWNFTTGGKVESSPAVVNGMVYVGSDDGNLYCLNASKGNLVWKYVTGSQVSSSPAVANGMVYVGNDGNMFYCLDASTGASIWNCTTWSPVLSSPAVANGMVYVGSGNDNLYCLNASTGASILNYTTGGWVYSSPALANGMVYVGSYDNNTYCFNASTGAKIWNFTTNGWVYSSPAVTNGMVYVGSFDGNIYCLNASTGAQIWNYDTQGKVETSPAVANGMVYVGSVDGKVYCLNATDGTLFWNYYTGGQVVSSPALANGMVYEGSNNGNFYCFPMIFIPSAPLNPTATPGNWQVSLSWNAPTNDGNLLITGYNIYRGTSSESETYLSTVGNVLNFTDTNVMPTTTYYYEVRAINPAGESANSTETSIITPEFTPTAPLNLVAVFGNKNITLTWQVPLYNGGSPITGYNIYRGTSSEAEVLLTTVGASTLTYIDTGLTNGETYYYKVSANNSIGEGPQSNEVNAMPKTIPSAPLNLQANWGNRNITLTWQAPSDNGGLTIIGYNIYRGTSSGAEVLLTTVGASTLTYIDTGLTNGETYYYKVSANNSFGEGPQSNEINAIPATNPSMPLNLNAIHGNESITLTWHAPSDNGGLTITGYNIYRGTSSGAEVLLTTVGASTLTYIDTGLTAGQTYYYTISAKNSAVEGVQSNEVHISPFGVPSVPLNLNATSGNNNITLTWQAPSDNGGLTIIGYNIYRETSSGTAVLLATVGASTLTYTDTGLFANSTYYYQVSAINSAGFGQKSSEINATTNPAPTSKNKIDGMGIESLLLVSFIGVIAVVLDVKKRLKQKLEENLI